MKILIIIGLWFLLSLIFGIYVGRFIHAGQNSYREITTRAVNPLSRASRKGASKKDEKFRGTKQGKKPKTHIGEC
jgi:hypothetical protein